MAHENAAGQRTRRLTCCKTWSVVEQNLLAMMIPPRTLWRLALVLAFVCGALWTLGLVMLLGQADEK
jgi:hypothetical protein